VLVGGIETIGTTNNRVDDVGGNCTEVVAGAYLLQCNQSAIKTNDTFTQIVGGLKAVLGTLGVNELIGAGRVERCSARVITCKSFNERVGATKRIGSGAANYTSGAKIATEATSGASLKAGDATFSGARLVITGSSVVVTCGNFAGNAGGGLNSEGSHNTAAKVITKGSLNRHAATTKASS
jgi:hypothetical protein